MARKQRTPDELRKVSNHLHYEIWMFSMMAQSLALGIAGASAMNNALLESFTIHARALFLFFYAEGPREDDVIAEDFFPHPEDWPKIRPAESPELKIAHERVGKQVAHLTYARLDVTPEAKPWPFIKINNELAALVKQFRETVPKDFLGTRWTESPSEKRSA